MTRLSALLLTAALMAAAASPVSAATPPSPATAANGGALVTQDSLRRQIALMEKDVRPDTTLIGRPVITADGTTAALEYWVRPRPPAVHVAQSEYVIVMQGAGWMLSGGTMTNGREVMPGLVVGDAIEGGARRELKPGDVFLIPAGMPHWFGIHGKGLVLLGVKLTPPAPTK